MRSIILIYFTLIIFSLSHQKTKPELGLSTDFLPTVEAFTDMKVIQTEYEKFKTKVNKNITADYESCVNALQTLKCNNIDQWQSVIGELQLEIKNSQDIEIPFLESKKDQKTEILKKLIEESDAQEEQIKQIIQSMEQAQKEYEINSLEINQMYKLPTEQAEFIQEPVNVPQELNSNGQIYFYIFFTLVPNVAYKQLQNAEKTYDIGDQSIQAQTINKEMHEASMRMGKTAKSLQASFDAKQKQNLDQKKKLKEDITRFRALINNEQEIQQKNQQKINELQEKINKCEGMPTSIEKDCLPIQLKGDKLNTELQILNARTLLLAQHIELMMNGFESEEQIQNYHEKQEAEKELQKAKEREQKFTQEKEVPPTPFKPKEQQPSMHFKSEEED